MSYIHWGPVIAGAAAATATSLVLMTFGSSIGLAIASTSPTWRDASVMLSLLSGVWILVIAVGSSALGGYIAGRVRSSWKTTAEEIQFRDGIHGLLVWSLALIVGAALTWAAVAAAALASGSSGSRTSSTSAEAFLPYELDRLFRTDRPTDPVEDGTRAEAGRIILKGIGRNGMTSTDRAYLARLVVERTNLAPADAERRVDQIVSDSRTASSQARRSAVILSFMTAASLMAGAAMAWFAACAGGQHRDNEIAPPLRWQARSRDSRLRT
jgi:hypothetical protein